MLPPEGPDDDGGALGPPLPPEDRLWRHPSELGSGAARPAATSAVAGLAGAGLTLATLTATGAFDDQVIRQQVVEQVAPSPASTLPVSVPPGQTGLPAVATLAAGVGPAVARVEVTQRTWRSPPVWAALRATMCSTSAAAARSEGSRAA